MTRRNFLRSTLLTSAGFLASQTLRQPFAFAAEQQQPTIASGPSRRVLADLHAHVSLEDWLERSPLAVSMRTGMSIATRLANRTRVDWQKCHEAGVNLMCVAHFNPYDEWASMPTDPNPEAPANTLLMMELVEMELSGPSAPFAKIARNHTELEEILAIMPGDDRFRIAAVHGIEGGHALGGSLEPLVEFARRGVAWMTLTHFFNKGIATATNAFPFFPDMSSRRPAQGLSDFGAEVIAEMERLGIIVDVTHCSATALDDVLRTSTKPLIATHATVRTLGDHPYSFYDEHILEIVRRGGLVGIVLYPFLQSNYSSTTVAGQYGSLGDVVRSIRYVTKICGTHKHIGIGSDFSGFITPPRDMHRLSEVDNLRRLLLEEFDGEESIVEDILANNAIDFLEKNWRSGQG